MKLHLDKDSMETIIDRIASRELIRRDVLEKDYYVTLLLYELSNKDNQGYAYFKGGTALYKALKSIRRFSEDINLTVNVSDCPNNSQKKRRLENATLRFNSIHLLNELSNSKGSIEVEYKYDPIFDFDNDDVLQRFGKVKVEATSFTVSEPIEFISISPYIYDLATKEEKEILSSQFDIYEFEIGTISLKRIFIDKIFASQFYYEREKYNDLAKHIYDITVLMDNDLIREFLEDADEVKYISSLKRIEEEVRLGGISKDLKVIDFKLFNGLVNDSKFVEALNYIHKIYVFNDQDNISLEKVNDAVSILKKYIDIGI